jgi:hypothetical protein
LSCAGFRCCDGFFERCAAFAAVNGASLTTDIVDVSCFNGLVLLIMLLSVAAHTLTALWDAEYTAPRRHISLCSATSGAARRVLQPTCLRERRQALTWILPVSFPKGSIKTAATRIPNRGRNLIDREVLGSQQSPGATRRRADSVDGSMALDAYEGASHTHSRRG